MMQGEKYAKMSARELSALADDLLLLQGSRKSSTHAQTAPTRTAGKQPLRRPQPPPTTAGAPPMRKARPSTARPAGQPVDVTARASMAPGPVQPRPPAPPERVDAFKRTASYGKARDIRIGGEPACGRVSHVESVSDGTAIWGCLHPYMPGGGVEAPRHGSARTHTQTRACVRARVRHTHVRTRIPLSLLSLSRSLSRAHTHTHTHILAVFSVNTWF